MTITSIDDDGTGTVELAGLHHHVDLALIEDPRPGDYVLIHAGFAIEKLDTEEANTRLQLFRSMAEIHQKETGSAQ